MRERMKKNLASEREKARVAELKLIAANTRVEELGGTISDLQQQLSDLEAKRIGQVAELEAKNEQLSHVVSSASDG